MGMRDGTDGSWPWWRDGQSKCAAISEPCQVKRFIDAACGARAMSRKNTHWRNRLIAAHTAAAFHPWYDGATHRKVDDAGAPRTETKAVGEYACALATCHANAPAGGRRQGLIRGCIEHFGDA